MMNNKKTIHGIIVFIIISSILILNNPYLSAQSNIIQNKNYKLASYSKINPSVIEDSNIPGFPDSAEKSMQSFKETAGLIYIIPLIKEILTKHGDMTNEDALNCLINQDTGHIESLDVDWNKCVKNDDIFYLPFTGRTGEKKACCFYLSENANHQILKDISKRIGPENVHMFVDEIIDIRDPRTSFPTGRIKSRYLIHHGRTKDWHESVAILIVDKAGRILRQKRVPKEEGKTGKYDVSTIGHVKSGEEDIETALREIKEETGLEVASEDLIQIGENGEFLMRKGRGGNELCSMYIYFKQDKDDIVDNNERTGKFDWIGWGELIRDYNDKGDKGEDYYSSALRYILNRPHLIRRLRSAIINKGEKGTNGERRALRQRVRDKNVLLISFRLNAGDLDGVSQETDKVAETLDEAGANLYYYSGETEAPLFAIDSHTFERAHFNTEEIMGLSEKIFEQGKIDDDSLKEIKLLRNVIKNDLKKFCKKNDIEYVIAENVLSFPGNIALSLAIIEAVNELNIKVIGHNHDFWWERERFLEKIKRPLAALFNLIESAAQQMFTIVINSTQKKVAEKSWPDKKALILPNVMDFENPPIVDEDRIKAFKEAYGIKENDIFLLLPARPVPRKHMERALDIAEELHEYDGRNVKVMVTHPAGDEGMEYWKKVKKHAANMEGVFLIDKIAEDEKLKTDISNIGKTFSLEDSYLACDEVLYTSEIEGWGNALVEAMYYKKPVIINPYQVYVDDIEPKGVKCIEIPNDQPITQKHLEEIIKTLKNPQEMVDHNYKIGLEHFSYRTLREKLNIAFEEIDRTFQEEVIKDEVVDLLSHDFIFAVFSQSFRGHWVRFEQIIDALEITTDTDRDKLKNILKDLVTYGLLQTYEYKEDEKDEQYKEDAEKGDVFYSVKETLRGGGKPAEYRLALDANGTNKNGKNRLAQNGGYIPGKDVERDDIEGEEDLDYGLKIKEKEIQSFINEIIKETHNLDKEFIIGFDIGWIPKVQRDLNVFKELLSKLKKLCKKHGIIICFNDNAKALAESINNERKTSFSNIIILGRNKIFDNPAIRDFMDENKENNIFFARLDLPKFISDALDVDIIALLNKTVKLAFSSDVPDIYIYILDVEKPSVLDIVERYTISIKAIENSM